MLKTISLAVLTLTLAELLTGCSYRKPNGPESEPTGELREFAQIADRLEQSENPYLGRLQIDRLKSQLATSAYPQSADLTILLSQHLLRLGKADEAVGRIDELFNVCQADGHTPTVAMHKARAMIYLRHAEVANCIKRHNAECCIFPLQGHGIHQDRTSARQAKTSLLAVLEQEPDNLLVQWLLNIAHMALGEYPDGVPEPYRIPVDLSRTDETARFVDVAPALGVDTFNLCGGVIVEDFTGDGLLDIVTSTYDPRGPLAFYQNLGDGSFTDRTQQAGLDKQLGGLNCIGADFDNDGDVDILVLRGAWLTDDGQIRNSLMLNNGNGTFSDVTRLAGLALPACPTQCAAWGDFDNDGYLDLFIGNESRVAFRDPTGDYPCQLFHNNGDGTFTDVARDAGVTNDRYAKGVTAGDYDNDGDLDIYVSNGGPNRLYRNNGNGSFTDVAETLGVTEPVGRSFATWFFDYNNDGWLDLFVAGYSASPADLLADYRGLRHQAVLPCLYQNQGNGSFRNVTVEQGLAHVYLPMGANFGDIDNDGFLDICLATGDPEYETLMPNVMLRNDRGRRFRDVTFSRGFGHLQKGHGVAFADLDHDGDQDIYNQLGGFFPGDAYHNALFVNPSRSHHYIAIELTGTESNRQGIGARITIELTDPPQRIHRAVGAVSSFGGSTLRQEIGLGPSAAIARLSVEWPTSGSVQQFTAVPVDCMIRLEEGAADFRVIPRRKFSLLQTEH